MHRSTVTVPAADPSTFCAYRIQSSVGNADPDSQIPDLVLVLGFLLNPDQMTQIDQTVQG
jgi:hypothetical protein